MISHLPGHVFVGREAELEALGRLLTADPGRPAIVVVEGPAGSGKTTLVDEFLARQPGLTVAHAGATAWESGHPYAVLEQLGVSVDPDADPVVAARALLPELRDRAGDGRLIVMVDGADKADAGSLMALHSAARRSPTTVRAILTARGPVRADLPDLRRLHISELDRTEVRQIALQAGVALTDRDAKALRDHTRGNPALVIELLTEAPDAVWTDWQQPLPATRRQVTEVRTRLEGAPPSARRLVEAVAVLGDRCSEGEATQLAEVTNDPVTALDTAETTGLVRRDLQLGDHVLRFADPMTRSAVLETMPVRRTHRLHGKAADLVGDEFRALSHRVLSGLAPGQELLGELRAYADRQAAEGAWGRAAHALIRASRIERDPARRTALLVDGVDALVGAGELPEANLFTDELEAAPRSARIDATLAYVSILRGRPAEADLLLDRAWQDWDSAQPEVRVLVSVRRVLHALGMWDPQALVEWSDRAIDTGDPDSPAGLEAAAMRGIGLAACGRWDEALRAYDELVRRVPTGPQSQRIRMGRGWVDLARGEQVSARHDFEGAVPTRFRMGSTRISLWAQAWLARSLFQLGDWDEALAVVARAGREVAESEHHLIRPLVHWTGVQVNALRGDQAAAREHLRRGAAASQDYPIMQIPAAIARANFAEVAADYEGVVRALEPLLVLFADRPDEPGFWPWRALYANALVLTDRADAARDFVAHHLALAVERNHRSDQAALLAVSGRIRCGDGDIDGGVGDFESALELLSGMPLPFERARVNFSYGQALRRAGRRRESAIIMRAARDSYATLGATSYVERCDRELNAAGLNSRRTDGVTDLTPQETAVADLVSRGLSNREAAEQLYISVKTVQYHLTRIYTKLGIRSRAELAARHRPRDPEDDT
ncbi:MULTISPECIES: LuxR family transcriptional regulator [unclassified Nocardioides]|uniref:LuxR family transcriptional regulator n=1 Tax=unclassified Nocardioides TaxID=2615069 RepID=UPI0009E6850B|nr:MULTISPECIES: LuxR family transcriptional regulator [unclassified Nocardioides]